MSPRVLLIAILAAGAVICAYLGHLEATHETLAKSGTHVAEPWIFIQALAGTIQIFPRGAGVLADSPVLLQIARVLALCSAALAAVEFWRRFFFKTASQFSLRWWRGHMLICGFGRKGRQLAESFRAQSGKIALIEKSGNPATMTLCRKMGVALLDGDAADELILRMAGIERASAAFVVAGRDQINLEIAMKMLSRYRKLKASQPFVCHVHIVQLALLELLQRQPWLEGEVGGFELKFFSIHQNTARTLFLEHPLEGRSPSPGMLQGSHVHLIIVGFGELGEAILLQAAAIGHYPGGKKLQITVVAARAQARLDEFLTRYPALREIVELQVVERPPLESLCPLADVGTRLGQRTVAVVAMEEDADNITYALRIASWRNGQRIPILVRITEQEGLNSLLAEARSSLAERDIHIFGAIEQTCGPEMLLGAPIDRLARTIHEDYLEKYPPKPGEKPSLAQRPWERLPEDFKQANRAQADHIDVKLRAIGCERISKHEATVSFSFTAEEIETLAETEHRRWMADKRLAGWVYGEKSDRERKLHASLIPWDRLSEEEKQKDRDTVLIIPKLLDLAGYIIRRP